MKFFFVIGVLIFWESGDNKKLLELLNGAQYRQSSFCVQVRAYGHRQKILSAFIQVWEKFWHFEDWFLQRQHHELEGDALFWGGWQHGFPSGVSGKKPKQVGAQAEEGNPRWHRVGIPSDTSSVSVGVEAFWGCLGAHGCLFPTTQLMVSQLSQFAYKKQYVLNCRWLVLTHRLFLKLNHNWHSLTFSQRKYCLFFSSQEYP